MNIKELENNMTKENIFRTFANLKTTNERLEFVQIMKDFYPNVHDINWVSVEETVMNEA